MWKGLKIVHGKLRHSQSQGSVERANRDIEDMFTMDMITMGRGTQFCPSHEEQSKSQRF